MQDSETLCIDFSYFKKKTWVNYEHVDKICF